MGRAGGQDGLLLFHLSPLETHLSRWPEAAGTHFPRGFISQRLERLSAKDPLDPFLSPFSPEGQERVGCIPYTCLSTALNSGAVVVGFCESDKIWGLLCICAHIPSHICSLGPTRVPDTLSRFSLQPRGAGGPYSSC